MALIFGVVAGLALGIGLAFLITIKMVKKSNDIGDSSAELLDVSNGVCILDKEDNLHSAHL